MLECFDREKTYQINQIEKILVTRVSQSAPGYRLSY